MQTFSVKKNHISAEGPQGSPGRKTHHPHKQNQGEHTDNQDRDGSQPEIFVFSKSLLSWFMESGPSVRGNKNYNLGPNPKEGEKDDPVRSWQRREAAKEVAGGVRMRRPRGSSDGSPGFLQGSPGSAGR